MTLLRGFRFLIRNDVTEVIRFMNPLRQLFVTFSLERKSNQKVQGQPDPLRVPNAFGIRPSH
jgi:hypothetical protein